MQGITALAGAIVAAASVTGVLIQNVNAQQTATPNIVETAIAADGFDTLLAAVQAAGLVEALASTDGITVLAPNDDAFGKLPQQALRNTINNDPEGRLADILKYHVIPGRLSASELASRRFVTTLDGQRLRIAAGTGLSINDANVIAADIQASNGVIHVLDTVLVPAKDNVVKTADNAGAFKTLLAAAGTAGLVDFLNTTDPITVFAPTDDAFAKLGDDTIQSLLLPENRDTLKTILAYHVVPGRVYSSDVLGGAEAETVAGPTIRAAVRSGAVFINDSTVLSADIEASNGVIHVIDAVLMPPSAETMASTGSAAIAADGPTAARQILTLAIDRGVPLFNDHQREACAAVYEVAIAALLTRDDLPADTAQALAKGLRDGRRVRDASDRAWAFRRAMDTAINQLGGMDETMTRSARN